MDIKELNEQLNGLLEQNNTITIEFLGGYATTEKTYYDNGSTGNIVNGWDNKQYETITVDPQNFMSRLADVAGSYLYCGFVTSSDLSLQIEEDGDYLLKFSVLGDEENEQPAEEQMDEYENEGEPLYIIDGVINIRVSDKDTFLKNFTGIVDEF